MSDTAERLARLYGEAFARYGTALLWSKRADAPVTPAGAAVVARTLRREGDHAAWALAREIDAACAEVVEAAASRDAADGSAKEGAAAAGGSALA